MSYREENGQVVLTMSREDYDALLIRLGIAMGWALNPSNAEHSRINFDRDLAFLNRLNEGNPHYTPYALKDKSA